MKQYLLAVQFDESAPWPSEEELQEQQARTAKVTTEMQSAGSWVFVGGLLPSPATCSCSPRPGGRRGWGLRGSWWCSRSRTGRCGTGS